MDHSLRGRVLHWWSKCRAIILHGSAGDRRNLILAVLTWQGRALLVVAVVWLLRVLGGRLAGTAAGAAVLQFVRLALGGTAGRNVNSLTPSG